jgi:hypothetical protein
MTEPFFNTLEIILNIVFIVSGIAVAAIPLIWDIKTDEPIKVNPSVSFKPNRKVLTKSGKIFIVAVAILFISGAIKYLWDSHSSRLMQGDLSALRDEVKRERINKKIQDYKKVLDISDKLSAAHFRWATFELKLKLLKTYPSEQDYNEMYAERKRTMDLVTNRSELIVDSSLNAQWNLTYWFAENYFVQKQIMEDLTGGIPKSPDFYYRNAKQIEDNKKNDYEFYRGSDSICNGMLASLKLYVNDKISILNKDLFSIK